MLVDATGRMTIADQFNCTKFVLEEYSQHIQAQLESESSVVFSTTFGPPAPGTDAPEYVICGAASGCISLYKIDNLKEDFTPALRIQVHTGACYSLTFAGEGGNRVLVSSGDDGRSVGYSWSALVRAAEGAGEGKEPKPKFELLTPQEVVQREWQELNAVGETLQVVGRRGVKGPIPEVNSAVSDSGGTKLYTGAGDGICHVWDLASGVASPTMSLVGHTDMVHAVALRSRHNQLVSASEDGTVRLWDLRSGKCCSAIDAWRGVAVPKAGAGGAAAGETRHWVSSVAVDAEENWIAAGCGGGRNLLLWSLAADACVLRIALPAPPQAVLMSRDSIISVGAEPYLSSFGLAGDLRGRLPTSSPSCYGLAVDQGSGMMAVGGVGGKVDVLSGLGSSLGQAQCE